MRAKPRYWSYIRAFRRWTRRRITMSAAFLQNFNISGLFGPLCVLFWLLLGIFWFSVGLTFWTSFWIALVCYLLAGGWRFQIVFYATLKRDIMGLLGLIQTRLFIHRGRQRNMTIGRYFADFAHQHPDKPCFYYLDEVWSFKKVDECANQVANCFAELGFRPGDDVALFLESKPEYVVLWLGLSRIGVVPALLNTHLRGPSLIHCVTIINCKAIIFGSELMDVMKEIVGSLKEKASIQYFCKGNFDPSDLPVQVQSLDPLVKEASILPPTCHVGNFTDRLFYVYTSGTTGMPKAAIIKHSRLVWMGTAIRNFTGIREDDVIYTALPLYHTASGIVAMCQCVVHGNTLAIRSRFSASRFWEDCIKYNCTVSHYIGELCRYLLAQPERPVDKQHKVRLMFGNGLRPEIWKTFVKRFGIQRIGEHYGSTEGNANVVNIDNKVGACGFISQIIPTLYPVTLIRVEPETGEPIRDEQGLCMTCRPGEVGEFVGKIITNDPVRDFDGYVNDTATKKKIACDVFRKGDKAFLSGDLLTMDMFGYLYFVDRTGDTFRWRGENVSTTEVEGAFSTVLKMTESVCYGVEIPGVEGRAGMIAVLDPKDEIDMSNLAAELRKVLPSYALPLFVRKVPYLERTSTYKYKKMDLKKEGFDPSVVRDPLYFLHPTEGGYVPLDAKLHAQICEGHIRL